MVLPQDLCPFCFLRPEALPPGVFTARSFTSLSVTFSMVLPGYLSKTAILSPLSLVHLSSLSLPPLYFLLSVYLHPTYDLFYNSFLFTSLLPTTSYDHL